MDTRFKHLESVSILYICYLQGIYLTCAFKVGLCPYKWQ